MEDLQNNEPEQSGILPKIKFSEFVQHPVTAMLIIALFALGYLFVKNETMYAGQVTQQSVRITMLETKVDVLTNQLRRSDSLLSSASSKIMVLQQLGKIK